MNHSIKKLRVFGGERRAEVFKGGVSVNGYFVRIFNFLANYGKTKPKPEKYEVFSPPNTIFGELCLAKVNLGMFFIIARAFYGIFSLLKDILVKHR